MTFSDAIRRQVDDRQARLRQACRIAVLEAFNSVTVGSAVTGSQGTPVDTGFALNSWSLNGAQGVAAGQAAAATIEPGDTATIRGGAVYLPVLEEGRRVVNGRTITVRPSKPIGWVRLTQAQWPAIVRYALQRAGLAS